MAEQVETYEAPNPESDEYHQQMVEKAEAAQNPQTTEVDFDRPAWLPEKFKTPEDLANSYAELERKLSSTNSGDRDELQEAEDNIGQAEQAVTEAGLDFDTLVSEYGETGELSEDSYEALNQSGIPKHIVDAFIQGQEAKSQIITNNAFSLVGGEDQYNQMLNWATNNLTEQEIDAFNANLQSQDAAATSFAIKGLYTQYAMASGVAPNLVQGTGQTGSGAFRSVAEMKEAMKDPKYKTDPAFRNEVAQRLAVSDIMN